MANTKNRAWSGKTGGTEWMQKSLIWMFARFSPWFISPIVAFWVIGYIIAQKEGRKGIYHYWRRKQNKSAIGACFHLYISYFWFGMAIMDRFAAYGGRKFKVVINGDVSVLNNPNGTIVISSHIGNQEMAGYLFKPPRPMHILLYDGDTKIVNQNREKLFNQMDLYFITMKEDGSHIFDMHNVLQNGEILSIHGDRFFYNQQTISATILGGEAPFPYGPFKMAASENVPVVVMFMMKEGLNNYTFYIKKIAQKREESMSKSDYAAYLVNQYTQALEEIIKKYPHQWFHFYKFWTDND